MNLFLISDVQCTGDILTIVSAIKFVFTLIQWAIPLVLIVLGTIDMFKAMASGDEKVTKEAQKKFIKRLIYAVVAFLIPFIISLVFTFVGQMINNDAAQSAGDTYNNFFSCWQQASSSGSGNSPSQSCRDDSGASIGYDNEEDCVNNGYIWD